MTVLLSTQEAATMLNLSQATVRRLARTGELPAMRFGRQLRFDADQLVKPQRVHQPRGHTRRSNGRTTL